MLAALNHPNIATIHGLERSGGTNYLVMELVCASSAGMVTTRRKEADTSTIFGSSSPRRLDRNIPGPRVVDWWCGQRTGTTCRAPATETYLAVAASRTTPASPFSRARYWS
jgi:hypothetical protein